MKNHFLLISTLILLSIFVIVGCGESKKEVEQKADNTEESSIEKQEQVEQGTEKQEQVETLTGDAPVAEEPEATIDLSQKVLKCKVILLDDLSSGNFRKLNKDLAKQLVSQGKMLVVKNDEGNIFFIYNEDGTFAGKRLAGYCNNNYIGIVGKHKNVNGVNVIIAESMESMD